MPSPGAQAPTGWIYIEVTRDLVRQPTPTFGIFASGEPFITIEQYIKGRGILGSELRDYEDGTRTYRLPNTSYGQFPEDPCHAGVRYLPFGNTRIPVQLTDPSTGKVAKTYYWLPLG